MDVRIDGCKIAKGRYIDKDGLYKEIFKAIYTFALYIRRERFSVWLLCLSITLAMLKDFITG